MGEENPQPLVDPSERGTNQRGVRAYNERLVLTLVRREGALSKAQIAKRTGLSPQTVSVIMRALEGEELIARERPVRGNVGHPSVPFSLAPNGALFFGLKIGRRSTELTLVDFMGTEIACRALRYRYPLPDAVCGFVREALQGVTGSLAPRMRERVRGLGIAMPFQMWSWPDMIGLPDGAMDAWRQRDLAGELAQISGLPVRQGNDCSAACNAELLFGRSEVPATFLYAYLGYFVGGGLVLDGTLYTGSGGNAGALASLPVPGRSGARQMIEAASLATLERNLERIGRGSVLLGDGGEWDIDGGVLEDWIAAAAEALAYAALSGAALLEAPMLVVDGWMPRGVRARLAERSRAALSRLDATGVRPPAIAEGSLGSRARSLGAASLVLSRRYMVDRLAIFR